MRLLWIAIALIVGAAFEQATGHAQTPAAEPAFDVVSIKPHVVSGSEVATFTMMNQRPDGGLTMTRVPVGLVLALAYQPMSTSDMVGLPDWALREYYDINATASLPNPSIETRTQMVRAMLAERFRLQAHRERREVPSFDLVPARADGKPGPALVRSTNDCDALMAARRKDAEAAARAGGPPPPPQRFDPSAPPPCAFVGMPNGILGELTIANLAAMLRTAAGRVVVDKTGLAGWYRVTLKFDFAAYPDLARTAPADDAPSVFTALREQLGLKLDPSRTERDVLVIDRLERPTEN